MKKILLIIIFNVILSTVLIAQNYFDKTIGFEDSDYGMSVECLENGGYIITGMTWSNDVGQGDVWLVKTDQFGDTLWTKTFGGTKWDRGSRVIETNNSDYIIAGTTQSFGAGNFDIWVIRTNPEGDTIWTKTFGGDRADSANDIKKTIDNAYIICGYNKSIDPYNTDLWLLKIDDSGDTLWTSVYGSNSYNESGYSIDITADSGYVVTGYKDGLSTDVWIAKFDSLGINEWEKTYRGSDYTDYGRSIIKTNDNCYLVAGSHGPGGSHLWMLKTDMYGDTLWAKTYGGDSFEEPNTVIQTGDGNYVVVGVTASYGNGLHDIWLLKIDTDGEVIWERTFGGNEDDEGSDLKITQDGGLIITGFTNSFGVGSADMVLIKTNQDGTFTSISENEVYISNPILHQNYPNPFNPETQIAFSLHNPKYVTLKVYNSLGQEVSTLISKNMNAGEHFINWNASKFNSGIYYYRIKAGDFIQTKKMVLIK